MNEPEELVTIRHYTTAEEASIDVAALKAAGINAKLQDHYSSNFYPAIGARIQVPRYQVSQAHDVLESDSELLQGETTSWPDESVIVTESDTPTEESIPDDIEAPLIWPEYIIVVGIGVIPWIVLNSPLLFGQPAILLPFLYRHPIIGSLYDILWFVILIRFMRSRNSGLITIGFHSPKWALLVGCVVWYFANGLASVIADFATLVDFPLWPIADFPNTTPGIFEPIYWLVAASFFGVFMAYVVDSHRRMKHPLWIAVPAWTLILAFTTANWGGDWYIYDSCLYLFFLTFIAITRWSSPILVALIIEAIFYLMQSP